MELFNTIRFVLLVFALGLVAIRMQIKRWDLCSRLP